MEELLPNNVISQSQAKNNLEVLFDKPVWHPSPPHGYSRGRPRAHPAVVKHVPVFESQPSIQWQGIKHDPSSDVALDANRQCCSA